jgi:hypothetical protein
LGLYNRVISDITVCINCNNAVRRQIQFKFGVLQLSDYGVGEKIQLLPEESAKKVVVDGAPEACPVCGYESRDEEVFAVEIDSTGVITGVRAAEPSLAKQLLERGVIVVEEGE